MAARERDPWLIATSCRLTSARPLVDVTITAAFVCLVLSKTDNKDAEGLRNRSNHGKFYLIVSETLPGLLSTPNPAANHCHQSHTWLYSSCWYFVRAEQRR